MLNVSASFNVTTVAGKALRGLCAELRSCGWSVDDRDYQTSFRVDVKGREGAEWEALKGRLPGLGLSCSFNLGKADIYPTTSGKANAVQRLQERLHLERKECVALFDDDNDIGMAALCGRRIAVSITHESVRQLVESDKSVEVVGRPGVLGTEEALRRVLETLPPL